MICIKVACIIVRLTPFLENNTLSKITPLVLLMIEEGVEKSVDFYRILPVGATLREALSAKRSLSRAVVASRSTL
jgi:hypothetical protein